MDKDYPMHFQTVLMRSDMEKLKEKSKQKSTKDALSIAVEHYLNCRKTSRKIEDEI